MPLAKRIEHNMVWNRQYFRQLIFFVGRAEGVHLTAKFGVTQPCFEEAAGTDTAKVAIKQGGQTEHRKSLQCKQHFGAWLALYAL